MTSRPYCIFISFLIAGLAPVGVQAADLLVRSGQTLTGAHSFSWLNETIRIEKNGHMALANGTNLLELYGTGTSITNYGDLYIHNTDSIIRGFSSHNVHILNKGTMISENGRHNLIQINGNNTFIQNDGILRIDEGTAIIANGSNSTIINNKLIRTGNIWGAGILTIGQNAYVQNNGTIITEAFNGYALQIDSSDSLIENNGLLQTSGGSASAITFFGPNSIFNQNGTIITTGDHSPAIDILSAQTTTHVTGPLYTFGQSSHGIQTINTTSDNVINLNHKIEVTGQNSHTVHLEGSRDRLFVNGKLLVSGNAQTALYARNNPILTFQSQSQVIGQIDVDATSQISVESYQAAPSTNLTIPNHGSLNIEGSHPILKQGNQVHRADSSGFVAQRLALAATNQTVHNHITTRLNRAPRLRPVQVASTQITPDLLTPSPQSAVWGGFIGGYQQMDQSRDHLAYQKTSYGLITGYDMPVGDHRLGFNLAFVNDSMQTNDRSIESDSKNLSTGVYGSFSLGTWQIAPALMLGYQFQENRRTIIDNLNGIETATSAQHNFSLSPALTISRPLTLDQGGRYQLRPLAQIAYHYGYFGGYTETGTSSSNLKIEGSSAHALKTRLQLSLDHQFGTYLQGGFSVRSGLDHHYRSADKINLSLGTARTRFDPTGKTLQMSGFVGLNLYYDVIDGLTVAGDIEVNRANNSGTHYQAALAAKWMF